MKMRPLRQTGMALVMVLWFIALLTVMVGAFSYSMRVESQSVGNSVVMARARAAAEAGVYWAIAGLSRPEAEREIRDDETPIDWSFGEAQVQITVLNESGLVDLNTGSRELLLKVFGSAGLDELGAAALYDAVHDFRDPDELKSLNGAEADDYERAGLPAPKNAPFESVQELQRVFGMNTELFRRMEPYLSVLNHSNGVNAAVAPRGLLLMLAEGDEGAVESWMAQREGGGMPNGAAPPFGLPNYWAPVRRNTYRITADSGFPDGTGRMRVQVTAFVYPLQRPPYVINGWREQAP